mgnify:FL=1
MGNYRAIPQGLMTVGEVAKKMGVSVRTLQYYDELGLLSPSAQSEGGRRLYSQREIIKLHQILSLKSLGFSLEEIKSRIVSLETPEQVASALSEQAEVLKAKISALSQSLSEVLALREEVLKMGVVDFKKYADIIVNIQLNNENYRLIKYFDENMLDHIRQKFDMESGKKFMRSFEDIQNRAIAMAEREVSPESEEAFSLAAEFWTLIEQFTGGDMSMLPDLMKFSQSVDDPAWNERTQKSNAFFEPALAAYFARVGASPFDDSSKKNQENMEDGNDGSDKR